MKINKRTTAALTAGAALLAIPAAAEPAGAYGYSGTLHRGYTTGIPRTVHRGQTITVELWFKQTSAYNLYTSTYGMYLWDPAGINRYGEETAGITLAWLDPRTHKWLPSDWKVNKGAQQGVTLPLPELKIASGVWNHIYARISFGRTTKLGTWHLEGVAPGSYYLLTKSGKGTGAILQDNGPRMQTVTVLR